MKPAGRIVDPDVRALAARATAFVERFGWCAGVRECRLALAVGGALGVFRVDLLPRGVGVDPTVWVVVGDLPTAYLAFEEADGWQDALRGYVAEMRRWVAAVRAGECLDGVVPVDAPAYALHADRLERRLDLVQQRLIDVDPAAVEGDG